MWPFWWCHRAALTVARPAAIPTDRRRWLSWPDDSFYDRTCDADDRLEVSGRSPAVRRYDVLSTSDLVRIYDEVLRQLYGPDHADQAETLHQLEYVIRARTGHDVRCSALRGGFDCDRRCDRC